MRFQSISFSVFLSFFVSIFFFFLSLFFSSTNTHFFHLTQTDMKFVVLAVLALACCAVAEQNDGMLVKSIDVMTPINEPEVFERTPELQAENPKNIDIATIVTIGKTVWEIIKEGKPVVDYKNDWAGAVPKGVAWNHLEGFRDYKWGPFGWTFTNTYGMTTVKFHWNFAWTCKGSYNGHGAFLMNVGTGIKEIYAAWGFTVNVRCTVDSHPVNYGTKVDPIAGLAVEVTLDVRTVLQSFTERCRVSLRGNCAAAKIAC